MRVSLIKNIYFYTDFYNKFGLIGKNNLSNLVSSIQLANYVEI